VFDYLIEKQPHIATSLCGVNERALCGRCVCVSFASELTEQKII